MYTFLSIIILVFAVLQIILFFKVWGMTNNVKYIAEKFGCYNETRDEVRKALLLDEKDKAVEILKNAMAQDIVEYAVGISTSRYTSLNSIYEAYKKKFEKLGITDMPVRRFEKAKEVRDLMN